MNALTHNFPSHRVVTVEVTLKDIERGQRRNDWSNPICRALFRTTGEKWIVSESSCYPITDRNRFIPLAPEVAKWIQDYNATGKAYPLSFQLELP